MIDHLFELYNSVVERFVLVLRPCDRELVRRHCERHAAAIEYVEQPEPVGMLDAVLLARDAVQRVKPRYVWITWCDQVAVHPSTIAKLVTGSCAAETAMVFPTIRRARPYIHLVRDTRGAIVQILHRREGDSMPEVGESDLGLFCLSADTYLKWLPRFASEKHAGAVTRERNFLPFIPWLAGRAVVDTIEAHDEMEAVGVNTGDELLQVERYLSERGSMGGRLNRDQASGGCSA